MTLREVIKSIGQQNYQVINQDGKILSKNFDQMWKGGIKFTPTNRKSMDSEVNKIILDSYYVENGIFDRYMLMWFKVCID